MLDIAKQKARLEMLESIKPLATFNGKSYYTQEEHQKFLDAVDPNQKEYIRQKDENGKTIFNGVTRVVVDPNVFFAITYWIDEENKVANFVTDPMALFAKANAPEFKMTQVQGFSATYDPKTKKVGTDYKRAYFNRETFINKFAGNLYEENPEMAIELFKTLSTLDDVKPAVSFKL